MKRAPGSYAGLTVRQADLLSFLRHRQNAGFTPSYDEMAEHLGLCKSGIHRLLSGLQARGYIERGYGMARSVRVFDEPYRKNPLERFPTEALTAELQRRGVAA